jgi:small subunit ribosomal protein S6
VRYACRKIEIGESIRLMVTKDETTAAETLFNDYELVFIVHPEVPDDGLDPIVNNMTQFITNKGGVIGEATRWGRKKLAYPIKHVLEGNYVLIKFKLDPSANKELENNLKISEKIMRYLLIKVNN